jgi:oxygen-independent coproporphyrinogen-3 oxidase
MLGLYIHVPFCSAICNYCNFNRGLFDAALKNRYVSALIAEVTSPSALPKHPPSRQADTIYFGGGTPSLLEPSEVAEIVRACHSAFAIADDPEITLEANPETVTPERLEGYLAAGVNRISFGVQSFRDDELRRLSRLHGVARARAAFVEARAAGFDNVSLDLMMWLPGQRVDHWLESVESAIALGPDHISLYLLELYPNAPLKEEMARWALGTSPPSQESVNWSQAPDDEAEIMYGEAMDRLGKHGYEQYELSNVARPGRRARHNLKYWTDGSWLGFGCGAHSTIDGTRWKNVSATEEYVRRIELGGSPATEIRPLSPTERFGDALFTALRLTDGVDLDEIQRKYGIDPWTRFGENLQPFIDEGLLVRQNRRLWLTRRGMLLANEVMAVFV